MRDAWPACSPQAAQHILHARGADGVPDALDFRRGIESEYPEVRTIAATSTASFSACKRRAMREVQGSRC